MRVAFPFRHNAFYPLWELILVYVIVNNVKVIPSTSFHQIFSATITFNSWPQANISTDSVTNGAKRGQTLLFQEAKCVCLNELLRYINARKSHPSWDLEDYLLLSPADLKRSEELDETKTFRVNGASITDDKEKCLWRLRLEHEWTILVLSQIKLLCSLM